MTKQKTWILCGLVVLFASTASANAVHQALKQMSPTKRAETLGSLISATEAQCVATRTFDGGTDDRSGSAFWHVGCANGASWIVQIANDAGGSTRLMECEVAAMLGIDCFSK